MLSETETKRLMRRLRFLMIKIILIKLKTITIDVDNFRSNPSFNAELSELN
jgi:hypothetical protein